MLFKQRLHGPLRQAEKEAFEISEKMGFEFLTFGIGKVYKGKNETSFRILGRKNATFLVHNLDLYMAEVLTVNDLFNYVPCLETFLETFCISWAPVKTGIELGSYVYPFQNPEMLRVLNMNLIASYDAVCKEFVVVQIFDDIGGRLETLESDEFPAFLKNRASANNVNLTDLFIICLNKYLPSE